MLIEFLQIHSRRELIGPHPGAADDTRQNMRHALWQCQSVACARICMCGQQAIPAANVTGTQLGTNGTLPIIQINLPAPSARPSGAPVG